MQFRERETGGLRPLGYMGTGYMGKGEIPLAHHTEKCVCYICGKDVDHVLSMNERKAYIEYVACKMFVYKCPSERDILLYEKYICNKCLKPGVKWNAEHTCNKQYACNQTYVTDGKEFF